MAIVTRIGITVGPADTTTVGAAATESGLGASFESMIAGAITASGDAVECIWKATKALLLGRGGNFDC